jgi:hypothetical protein
MDPVSSAPPVTTTPPTDTGGTPPGGGTGNTQDANLAKLAEATQQTLAIQNALFEHNMKIGVVMAAKSASEDAKKT